jgi:hypothetical protein
VGGFWIGSAQFCADYILWFHKRQPGRDETSGRFIFGSVGVLFLFVTLAAGVFKRPKGSGG